MASRRLGQILVDLGHITEDQLWDVLEEQKKSPGDIIGRVALRMGLVSESQITEALAEQWGMAVVNLKETNIPPKVLELVPQTMAEIYKIMPISLKNDVLTVAMADPQNMASLTICAIFLATKSGELFPITKMLKSPLRVIMQTKKTVSRMLSERWKKICPKRGARRALTILDPKMNS